MSIGCLNLRKKTYINSIKNVDISDRCYSNILEKKDNYELDIITIFKTCDIQINKPVEKYINCDCPLCYNPDFNQKLKNLNIQKNIVYIMIFMKTICEPDIESQIEHFLNSEYGPVVRNKIKEYYQYLKKLEVSKLEGCWENLDFYFLKYLIDD